jgi:hypothetical protein
MPNDERMTNSECQTRRPIRRIRILAFELLSSFLCLPLLFANAAFGQSSREFQLKAAFLYNFAQFTEWPAEAFAVKDAPIVIGVLGKDPFGTALDDTVRDEFVRGKKLVIERYRTVEEIKTCHILYISQSESNRLDHILEKLDRRPILTVSDIPGSAPRGVMIRFVPEGSKIRFRINAEAAKAEKLSLSSKLLRVAEIVTTKKR